MTDIIKEILNDKSYNTLTKIKNRLDTYKEYQYINSGDFAIVYLYRNDVIKIFKRSDEGYSSYLKFCSMGSSIHLPVIINEPVAFGKFILVSMEKVATRSSWTIEQAKIFNSLVDNKGFKYSLKPRLLHDADWQDIYYFLMDNKYDYTIDLKPSNFGFRKDNTIVLLDPLGGRL